MRQFSKIIVFTLALITFFGQSRSIGQKLDGVYSGTFKNEVKGIVELKGGGDFITGIVQTNIGGKWVFYCQKKGTSFDNHYLLDLGTPYVKGELQKDTLYLSLDTRDSSYVGVFIRVKKKNEEAAKKEIYANSISRDNRLVGEWICIDDSAPAKYRSINWKMTLLESGVSIPDYEAAKRQFLKYASENGLKSKNFPAIKIHATWRTTNNNLLIITHESLATGVEEIVSSYELRNDTLRLTNLKNYTSVFIRNLKK